VELGSLIEVGGRKRPVIRDQWSRPSVPRAGPRVFPGKRQALGGVFQARLLRQSPAGDTCRITEPSCPRRSIKRRQLANLERPEESRPILEAQVEGDGLLAFQLSLLTTKHGGAYGHVHIGFGAGTRCISPAITT
jgi:hypothetical protein